MRRNLVVCGSEIANNIYTFGEALSRSHNVLTVCFNPNTFYGESAYDIVLASSLRKSDFRIARGIGKFVVIAKKVKKFLELARCMDSFIYIWHETFIPLKLDLLLLRILSKKVMVFHCGDDVRYRPIQSKLDQNVYGVQYFDPSDSEALRAYESSGNTFIRAFLNQHLTEKFGATLVSLRSHATFQKKPHFFFRFPQKRLLEGARRANTRPLLIHAPSSRVAKNTDCVIEAVDLLRARGCEFDFELIEGRSNEYVVERLLQADIVIDQPGPWIGRLGAEALAASCVVVGGNQPDYYDIEEFSPVVQFLPNSDDLSAKLERLISSIELRSDIMKSGFAYWERYYSEEAFAQYVDALLDDRVRAISPVSAHRENVLRYAKSPIQRALVRMFL